MLLAIMLFIIGQALNLSTSYWIVWGVWLVVQIIGVIARFIKNCMLIAEIEELKK